MRLIEAQELRGVMILITGASGFISSHLVDACVDSGAVVHEPVRATSSWALSNIAGKVAALTSFEGEFRWDTTKPDERLRRRLDTSREWQFGSYAEIPLDGGLRRTVEWYLEQQADADPRR